jgi:pseudouridine-5'-phosphate glycosidase/sugar/nucleoside kinase (ribokinase family)
LDDLARAGQDGRAKKCSTRDLGLILARHAYSSTLKRNHDDNVHNQSNYSQWGATTVASTMKLAHLAGISVFVTGGIGGVHRGAETTMDISADLIELSRTPVIVVSAGIKSILDIPRTLEVLETYSVPTVAYATDEFPAFFSPHSGVKAPARVDDVQQIASSFLAAQELGLSHGMLVAVPNHDPAGAQVEDAIRSALAEATEQSIHGHAVTPFILKRVAEMTKGESLKSNMCLVEQNSIIGAEIANAICTQRNDKENAAESKRIGGSPIRKEVPKSQVVVMGGIVLDIIMKPADGQRLLLGTSFPATCKECEGGVARNVAEVLGRLGSRPLLYSAVGSDARAAAMIGHLAEECGVVAPFDTVHVVEGANTATYFAVLNESGELHTACADMDVLKYIQPPPQEVINQASLLFLDANAPVTILHQTALYACSAGTKVFFEPTSVPKAALASRHEGFLSCITYASPNIDELSALADGWRNTTDDHDILESDDDLSLVRPLAEKVINRMHPNEAYLIITCGAKGVLLVSRKGLGGALAYQRFAAPKMVVQNATGAGDSLCGAFIHAIMNGKTVSEAVEFGMQAASMSLQCLEKTIAPSLSSLRFQSLQEDRDNST